MLKLIKEFMFKFDKNKELTHTMWEAYVSVLQCSQKKFETNQELFKSFNNATRAIMIGYGTCKISWIKRRRTEKFPGSRTGT